MIETLGTGYLFFAENGQEGLEHLFLVQKSGGKFFLGSVKNMNSDVGNYR